MSDRHVVVVSVDAMVYEDLAYLSQLWAFAPVWERTARVDRVRSIYPSVTYPCHATMMTGVYPESHGVVSNDQPTLLERSSPWRHMRADVKGRTIFDEAKAHGLTTAAVFWPTTGNDPSIDWLVDEYWPQHGESLEQCFRDSGSTEEVMREVVLPNLHHVANRVRQHPYCDQFVMSCACDILRKFTPNLLMMHPANVDAYRHETGLFTSKVDSGLQETNLWFAQLMKAADDAGILEKTDFFIVSDHGQLGVTRNVALNALLEERGLIELDAQGGIRDFTAFAKSNGLSSLIYLKHPEDPEAVARTQKVLDDLWYGEMAGIGRVFTAEEAHSEYHLAGDFSFVVEGDGYTSFSNDWLPPRIRNLDNRDYRFGRASHGHLPEKGPQPTLFAFGPHIQPGVVLPTAQLVDEAPTFAHCLGFDMPDADGRCLRELFGE